MESKDTDQPKPTALSNGENTTAEFAVDDKRAPVAEPKESSLTDRNTTTKDVTEDGANDADLSSPPSSSSVSSVNPDMLGDEIVVGTRANGDKSPARRVALEREDVEMADVEEDEEPVNHYPKRKRVSQYADLNDEKMDNSSVKDTLDANAGPLKGRSRQRTDDSQKQVTLGSWRDSPVPNEEKRHSVVGFIDVRDRLRTRVVSVDLDGDPVNSRLFPIPPGPGGSWVTFERIVFLDHLVGHDHNVIKEYVKVRSETLKNRTAEADVEAIREAQRRLEADPPPETPVPPAIAWGKDIPDHVRSNRPEVKRRRYGSGVGTIADRTERSDRAEHDQQVGYVERPERPERAPIAPQPPEIPQPPRKPTRILVGVWSKSTAPEIKAKHAVYGILGANDMFRVKLVRETIEGKFVDDNFPSGAGALWIPYDEVMFLDHLKDLSRPEVKEYVRIRQSQIDAGEMGDDQRIANETKAVYEAQTRAAAIAAATPNKAGAQASAQSSAHGPSIHENQESRHPRREAPSLSEPRSEPPQPPRKSLPEVEIRQATRHASNDPLERVQGFANREVARMEAVQMRTDRHQASRNATNPGTPMVVHDNRRDFQENVHRMQQVWQAQENMRRNPSNFPEDVMMHMGVRYERKQSGPFKDRLVSQGTIINIDGEDYVEYRVLTKPTFF
ncbi:hypothetical protein F4820DRAFT_415064 [Hypoxylon rubiginosum]|uniref:Uncharacterized protein n=1 Tax=Hypoxylon rubiginosum TaxID=110542 RepID=A0ACB9Z7C1_9PEZI|nr:hypothetical protein F4820DRAFT_415064 [Hypoxylon rubiginosum]